MSGYSTMGGVDKQAPKETSINPTTLPHHLNNLSDSKTTIYQWNNSIRGKESESRKRVESKGSVRKLLEQLAQYPDRSARDAFHMIPKQALKLVNIARLAIGSFVYIFASSLSIPQSCVYTTTNSKINSIYVLTHREENNVGNVSNYTVTCNTHILSTS